MLFHTPVFLTFFITVYAAYLLCHFFGGRFRLKSQNLVLLGASYWFYGSWNWKFLSLLFLSTVIDFFAGREIARAKATAARRKAFLALSIVANLSFLGIFKYADFFAANFQELLALCGLNLSMATIDVVLPVGISFYTFQTMSYSLDIYAGKLKPINSFSDFALYVSFFPQLVAGPIERAARLIPQIVRERRLEPEMISDGVHLFFIGFFLKVFVADNLALVADRVFALSDGFSCARVLLGGYAFAFEIYGDFAGYTYMARGIAKLMGFDLMLNFRNPYFAADPGDFWRRWHISLSSWLRDYLYIPLGGNRGSTWFTYRNLMITMLLGGLWHGAAWHFVMWGLFHGLLLIGHRRLKPVLARAGETVGPRAWKALCVFVFFHLTVCGWILFRGESAGQIMAMARALVSFGGWAENAQGFVNIAKFILPVVLIDVLQFRRDDELAITKTNFLFRTVFYLVCSYMILLSGAPAGNAFIYFQF